MKISKDTFSKMADMVKLSFTKEEETQIREDLNKKLKFIDAMNLLETDNVEPLTFVQHTP